MIINDDVIASIDENLVDVNAGWLWADCSVYSPDYASELTQPISVEASTLYDLRFVSSASNIIIRTSNISNSRILWAGWVEFINDIVPNDPVKLDVSALNTSISTGCIRNNLPELIKSTDNFIVPSFDIAIYPTSNFRGIIENHTVTSAAFTIPRDGVSYYVVANYNSGFPFLQLTSDRSQINQSDKVALYVAWNVDGNIHAIGFDNKGEGLANKVDSMIINTVSIHAPV